MMLRVPSGRGAGRGDDGLEVSWSLSVHFPVARCLAGMQPAYALWLVESGLGLNCWFVSHLPPVLSLN